MTTLSCGIITCQHRLPLAKKLAESLPNVSIYNDFRYKGVWWNAKRTVLEQLKKKADYYLISQEDILICKDFIPFILSIIEALHPPFFTPYNRFPNTRSIKDTWRIAKYPTNGVCYIASFDTLINFIPWAERNFVESFWSDDARLYTYLLENNIPARVIIPGLCQHMWWVDSTEPVKHGPLRATNFIGENASALSLDMYSGYDTLLPDSCGVPLSTWNKYRK